MKAVIIAGGRGTRLHSHTGDSIPKALVPVAGAPIIHRQFQLLRRYGVSEVIILAGHLAEALRAGSQTEAHRLGLTLRMCVESSPLGTGGGLPAARVYTGDGPFLVLCGDIAVEMDLQRLMAFHQRAGADATIVVHPNDHPHTSDLLVVGEEGRVKEVLPRGQRESGYYRNLVFGSVYVLSPAAFNYIDAEKKQDLNNEVFPRMIRAGARVLAYNTPEYLRDVGTVERLAMVERDIESGYMTSMNWANRRPTIFFDRDGVLVEDVGSRGVTRPEDLRLLPGAAEAVRSVNEAGYLAVVVSNQPGIAKGFLSPEDLEQVTARLEMELGNRGAWLDRIYHCPHHPESGFDGERSEFKVSCACRKPQPGMLLRAAEDLPIDMGASCLIGDSARDMGAARAAGVQAYGVRTGHGCDDCDSGSESDRIFEHVLDAVTYVLARKNVRRVTQRIR